MPEGTIFSKRRSDVWVHIYHCDPYTGFLNRPLGRIRLPQFQESRTHLGPFVLCPVPMIGEILRMI